MALTRNKELSNPNLFDETAGYEDETGIKLARGLNERERKQATILYRLFNELWGVCIIVGDPGMGKDVFGNYLSYILKRYFPHKRTLRDEKPRKLYGSYAGLFNEQVLSEDLAKMREIAKGIGSFAKGMGATKIDDVLEKAADDWVSTKGIVLLKNSILYLTEYWRYCYNREPHNPMNKTMGAIHKEKRHINVFIIGTVQLTSELDRKTCLPWIDWRVTCTRSRIDTTKYTYFIEKVKYDRRVNILVSASKPLAIPVDAGKPRSFIGDGKIVIKKPNYQPETEEERIVLDVIKAGADNYEDLVEFLETEGDMSEAETLTTLKQLCLKLPGHRLKSAIWYPCYYFLFNSKSAPQIKTSLKAGD